MARIYSSSTSAARPYSTVAVAAPPAGFARVGHQVVPVRAPARGEGVRAFDALFEGAAPCAALPPAAAAALALAPPASAVTVTTAHAAGTVYYDGTVSLTVPSERAAAQLRAAILAERTGAGPVRKLGLDRLDEAVRMRLSELEDEFADAARAKYSLDRRRRVI